MVDMTSRFFMVVPFVSIRFPPSQRAHIHDFVTRSTRAPEGGSPERSMPPICELPSPPRRRCLARKVWRPLLRRAPRGHGPARPLREVPVTVADYPISHRSLRRAQRHTSVMSAWLRPCVCLGISASRTISFSTTPLRVSPQRRCDLRQALRWRPGIGRGGRGGAYAAFAIVGLRLGPYIVAVGRRTTNASRRTGRRMTGRMATRSQ